jgi:hypothetical protein
LPEKQAIHVETSAARGDEVPARVLASLDAGEREKYYSLSQLIASRPSQFLYALLSFKEMLTTRLPLHEAFEIFRALLKLPSDATVEYRPVKSLFEMAARHAIVYRETAAGGNSFTAQPPRVIGPGDQRPLECVTRSLYVACLSDTCVRSRSTFIEFRGAALLDFEGREYEGVEDQLALDLPVLKATEENVWIGTSQTGSMEIDEAFNLLGPHSPQFGHWIWEYMPKYIAATMAAEISDVSVLVDAHMPSTHTQLLRMVIPADTKIIQVPLSMSVRARRLWCAPTLCYVPLYPKTLGSPWPASQIAHPERFAAVMREMWRRMEPALPARSGPERLFLARKPEQHRKLVNHKMIEELAQAHGFAVIYPQDLDFADQVSLVRSARYIVGPEGSAPFLNFLARPETKLCTLSSPYALAITAYTCLLRELGVDTTVLTGPVVSERGPYAHFADYSIPEETFQTFLENWLA